MNETNGRFNPSDHLIKLGTKDYLPVAWRIAWFRDVCPEGVIATELIEHDAAQGRALFKATIGRKDSSPDGAATGYGSETVGDFGDYIEKAETKAVGRALAMLGFGTQFCDDFDEGGAVTDAPVERRSPAQQYAEGRAPAPRQTQRAADERQMEAKFKGECYDCGDWIAAGRQCIYMGSLKRIKHCPGECRPGEGTEPALVGADGDPGPSGP